MNALMRMCPKKLNSCIQRSDFNRTALSQSLALICVKQNLANSPFVPLHRFSLASRTLQAISAERFFLRMVQLKTTLKPPLISGENH